MSMFYRNIHISSSKIKLYTLQLISHSKPIYWHYKYMTFLLPCSSSQTLISHAIITEGSWFRRPWEFGHDYASALCLIATGRSTSHTSFGGHHTFVLAEHTTPYCFCSGERHYLWWKQTMKPWPGVPG